MTSAPETVTGRLAGPLSWVLATLAAFLGIVPVFIGGVLVVPPYLIVPAAVLSGGILAGLVAGWVRTAVASDSSSRLLAVVGTTAAAALVLVAPVMALGIMFGPPVPIIVYPPAAALVLGGVATWAAGRFRNPDRHLARDAVISLGLAAAGAAVVAVALFGFCATLVTCMP